MSNSNQASHSTEGRLFVLQAYPPRIISLDINTGSTETIFEIKEGTPDGIQVHKLKQKIFWTNMGAMPAHGEEFPHADGSIECCNLDGSSHLKLFNGGAIVTPKQLQLAPHTDHLYWCDREGMAIYRCSLKGHLLTELYRSGMWPQDSLDVLKHCVGIALDVAGGHIYWTQKGPPDGGEGRIYRMALEVPAGQTSVDRSDVELMLSGLPEPIDLEIDENTMQIYWTDRGLDEVGGNSLNRADITPRGLVNHKVIARGLKEGIGLALDTKQRKAFVADLSGAVRVVPIDGGNFETVHLFAGPITGISFAR